MPRPNLSIVGCTVVDVLLNRVESLPRWPNHSEFTRANLVLLDRPPVVTVGGNGANAALVASRLGARVELYSPCGDDELGRMARRWLEEAGCTLHSPRRSGATACNVTAADDKHRRATFFFSGTPPKLSRLEPNDGGAVLVCGWPHPPLAAIAREFKRLRQKRILTALDLGPILGPIWSWTELTKVLKYTGLLLGNRHEMLALTGERRLERAVDRLRRVCPGDIVVKRGGEGAMWSSPSAVESRRMPARKVRVINTVGAGDSFNGALLAAILRGETMPDAIAAAVEFATRVVASDAGVLGSAPGARRPSASKLAKR